MPFWFAVVLAASGVSGRVRGLCAFFVAVLMTISAAVANFGGRGRLRRPDLVLQKAQTSAVIGGVVDTGKQFIAGVVDTGDKFSLVRNNQKP